MCIIQMMKGPFVIGLVVTGQMFTGMMAVVMVRYSAGIWSQLPSFQAATCSDPVVQRRHLERSDLQNYTIKDLNAVCTSLSQATKGM